MTAYKLPKRQFAALMAFVMIISMMSGCLGKDKSDDTDTKPSSSSSVVSEQKADEKSTEEESPSEENSKEEKDYAVEKTTGKKTEKTTAKSKETTTKKTSPVTTTAAPVKVPSNPVVNSRPSQVENATDSSDLADVNPNDAANNSYGTDVSVSQTVTSTLNTAEYTYVPHSDFDNHIFGVWRNFQTKEKVKVENQYVNEYLNYICLPLKNSFAEINCQGYDVVIWETPTDTAHKYLDITWSYYINASQYATCKSKASEIISGLSGSTANKIRAVHDRLGKENAYALNVDGPYNCLVNHRSDCDGYTAAFQICMDLLGIPCKAYSTSDHIFNLVQVDGRWYVVDVTYDDQSQNGFVYARYFLVGSSMYSNYPILKSTLSATDYNCSKKVYVTDDAKFRTFLGMPNSQTYTLEDDGKVNVYTGGQLLGYYTLS